MEKEKKICIELTESQVESVGIMVHFWLENLKTDLHLSSSENDLQRLNELLEDIMIANTIYESIHKDVDPILPPVFEFKGETE